MSIHRNFLHSALGVAAVAGGFAVTHFAQPKPQEAPQPAISQQSFALNTGVEVCGADQIPADVKTRKGYQTALTKYTEIAAQNPEGRDMQLGPMAACFAEGTKPEVMAAFMEAMSSHANGGWPVGPEYFLRTRWSQTGSTTAGTPVTVTWSFVPDGLSISSGAGEPVAGSSLFATLDAQFAAQGGRATWISRFEGIMARWSQISGITLVRVKSGANDWDDGASWGTTGNDTTRGDLRISMKPIDGINGILAYNYFPTNGDMVVDASENWASSSNFHRFLRNTLAHENGHGLGLSHVCSNNSAQLMEPFLSTAFDGPQHDDIRAMHSQYGDPNEPNNTTAQATAVGTLPIGTTIRIGTMEADGSFPTMPIPATSSMVSLHNTGTDKDLYSITTTGARNLNVTATPVGFTYDDNAQAANGSCPSGSSTNSLAIANLRVRVLDTNGTTVLLDQNTTAAGAAETGTVLLPAAGTYFVEVGAASSFAQTQFYTLDLLATQANQPPVLSNVGSQSLNELVTFSFDVNATDPDVGQTLTYSLQGEPSGMTINPTSGVIQWAPTEAQGPGDYTFTIVVTDNGSPTQSDSEVVTWSVVEVNRAPTLTVPASVNVTEGQAATFNATATDPDLPANTLNFSLVSPPGGATIGSSNGAFTWTPSSSIAGTTVPVNVRVTDNGTPALSDEKTVNVNILISQKTVSGTVTLQSFIPDEAGQSVSYEVAIPGGAVVATGNTTLLANGGFSFNLSGVKGGTYDITFKGSHWLAQKVASVILSPSGATGITASLVNGDVDGDNEVGPSDFSLLSAAFGTVEGDPGYNAAADLDGDGEVGPSDFSVLATNFGQSGD